MASLLVAVGLTPDQYRALTVIERNAIVRAVNQSRRRR